MPNRVVQKFAELRARGQAAFMPFLTAGDPDYETTRAIILELEKRGADLIELGIPYSDPVADGPIIQASFARALSGGATVQQAFAMLRALRKKSQIPVLTMVSYSIVHRLGSARFVADASAAGADGAIIPDLPVDEAAEVIESARAKDFCTVFLAAPTTTPERRRLIARHSTGFIYYISVAGVTGARDRLPEDLPKHLAELKALTSTPIAVGFGVSTPAQARAVAQIADGVIVGSAIVRVIAEHSARARRTLVTKVGAFAAELAAGVKAVSRPQPGDSSP